MSAVSHPNQVIPVPSALPGSRTNGVRGYDGNIATPRRAAIRVTVRIAILVTVATRHSSNTYRWADRFTG
jgi:hypothetical protein